MIRNHRWMHGGERLHGLPCKRNATLKRLALLHLPMQLLDCSLPNATPTCKLVMKQYHTRKKRLSLLFHLRQGDVF